MPFLIYNVRSTKVYLPFQPNRGPRHSRETYFTEAAAKAALTKLGLDKTKWAVAEVFEFLRNIEKSRPQQHPVTGKSVVWPVNANRYRDASSALYWAITCRLLVDGVGFDWMR